MTEYRDVPYGARLPASFLKAIQEFVGSYTSSNFLVKTASPTGIQIVAGTDNDQVSCGINGRWRFITSTISAAHPGGAAGTYDVFATASDNNFIAGTPETDATVYAFGLQILASGSTPSTALYRKVAQVVWSGTAITSVLMLEGASSILSPNVGIGTSSPVTLLEVSGSGSTLATVSHTNTHGVAGDQTLHQFRNSVHSSWADLVGAAIGAEATTATDGALVFKTRTGAGGSLTEQVRIASAGAVTMGSTLATKGTITVDPVSGTASAQITLTGRNSGAPASATLVGSTTGALSLNAAAGSVALAVGGLTYATVTANTLTVAGSNPSLVVDAGSGTNTAVALLTARNAGTAKSLTVTATSAGNATYDIPSGGTHTLTINGSAALTVSSTLATVTGTGLTVDPSTGTSAATLTLSARNAGTAKTATLVTDTSGNLTLGVASALAVVFTVNAVESFRVSASGVVNVAVGGDYRINGTSIFASPALTGTPTAPTAAVNTSTTQVATTAFVLGQVGTASPLMDGVAAVGTSFLYARQDHVHPTDTSRAAVASPTFTGTPAGPTAAVDTNTTQLATTAFVIAQAASAAPLMDGAVTVGTSTRYARADHVHATDTSRAPLASPTFTGVVTAPNVTISDTAANSPAATLIVSDAAVDTKRWQTVGAATTLTFRVQNDAQSSTQAWLTVTRSAATVSTVNFPNGTLQYGGNEVAVRASPSLTGTPTAPTAAVDTSTTQIATTAYVVGQGYLKSATATSTYAPLASPTLTGTPAAPTAAVDTNTTQIATTAYVIGQGYLKSATAASTYLTSATAASTYAPIASPTFTGTATSPILQSNAATPKIQWFATGGGADSKLWEFGANTTQFFGRTRTDADTAGATWLQVTRSGTSISTVNFLSGTLQYGGLEVATLASPALTGTPTAPTAAAGTNTTQLATTAFVQAALAAATTVSLNTVTTDYTVVLSDAGGVVQVNSASPHTVTIPADATTNFPVGTIISIVQLGTGLVTVAGAVGCTVNANPGLNLAGRYAQASLYKRAANLWVLAGNLTP